MATKHGEGLYPRIIAHYGKSAKSKKMLFNAKNLMKHFDIDEKAAKNALYFLHRNEKICRHIDKNNGQFQYAISIEDKFNDPYKPTLARSAGTPSGQQGHAAITKMFAAIQNQMARLEDMIYAELAEAEKVKKQKKKVTALMRSMKKLEEED